ncbi:60S acidic ribosomal protein P0-1 [Linum grandiflorum]
MVGKPSKADKKLAYDSKMCQLLDDFSQILVVAADNVGSSQLQSIRRCLRGDSIVLMGKNTMMKRTIRVHSDKTGNKAILNLLPLLQGNVGLIFTKGDLKEVREEVAKYKVGAPARVGLVAPVDVVVPPGGTGLDPSQTSFFQVLNIPTKINKGAVEIVTPVELIKKGEKVGSSEAALLAKLASGVSMVTAFSLAISYPTLAAASHMFIGAYKNVLSIAVDTDYTFPQAEQVKEYLKDPSKFAIAAAVDVVYADKSDAPAAAKEEKKEEPEEESDDEPMGGLFDDDF